MGTTSGFKVSSEARDAYTQLKFNKKSGDYLLLSANWGTNTIELSEQGQVSGGVELKGKVAEGKPLHVIYDGGQRIAHIVWSPDDAPARDKMGISASVEAIQNQLEGLPAPKHISSGDELVTAINEVK
ncbi:cofilin family protein [Streptomyces sp. NPDC087440]|uniref:cofilin family protein n=1 Tax=Streptomyces sp. NPDC087440 TaxID=3365790 RepID=UPI0037F118F5